MLNQNIKINSRPHFTIIILFVLFSNSICSQNEFRIKLSTGKFYNPWNHLIKSFYHIPQPGNQFKFSFEYDITHKVGLRFSMLDGLYRYYDSGNLTNDPTYVTYRKGIGTNVKTYDLITGPEVFFTLYRNTQFKVNAGVGAGILFQVRTFTTRYEYDDGPRHIIYWDNRDQVAFHDLCFPISISFEYKLLNKLGLFFESGAYVEPDFPVMGLHVGVGTSVGF